MRSKILIVNSLILTVLMLMLVSCGQKPADSEKNTVADTQKEEPMFTPLEAKVKLMNLDPGHFHASLVQKTMYADVDPKVHVYAPDGPEVQDYQNRITDYNSRAEDPTAWDQQLYLGDDFFQKMIADRPGNVMVVSGKDYNILLPSCLTGEVC